MIRNLTAALVLALVTPVSGHAEGRLSYTAQAGDAGRMKMTERWRGNAMRTDIEGVDAYMLMRDGTIYSIISMAGRITVMDLGQLQDAPGAGAAQSPSQPQVGGLFPETIEEMRAAGETREIAGIEGEVYDVEWTDNTGQAQTDTAVLSDDPRLLENQSRKMRQIEAMSGEPPNPLLVELDARGLAPLSFGDRYLVTEVSGSAGPAGDFELPAEPLDLGGAMGMGQK
jgi:hypothetical protein